MKLIGITGGVGAGKTQVLSYLASHCSCRIPVSYTHLDVYKRQGLYIEQSGDWLYNSL